MVSDGPHNTEKDQALSALLTLGFARANAEKALQQAVKNLPAGARVEELIKISLSYL
jgi:Holliday junction DNA helicase RuvA